MRYTQKDICKAFDVTRETLRHYERLGILSPEVDPNNGYRYYDDWQINLLWECKRYQAMGFSLSEVSQILHSDTMGGLTQRIERRVDELEQELAYQRMRLEWTHDYRRLLRGATGLLGTYRVAQVRPMRYVARREVHDLLLDDSGRDAGSFVNAHQAICSPFALFPRMDEPRYFWGFVMWAHWYDQLGGPYEGSSLLPGGRALVTCVDAGGRGGFGLDLFSRLIEQARAMGERPAGPLYGYLLARAYGEDGSYHRYVEGMLPLLDDEAGAFEWPLGHAPA